MRLALWMGTSLAAICIGRWDDICKRGNYISAVQIQWEGFIIDLSIRSFIAKGSGGGQGLLPTGGRAGRLRILLNGVQREVPDARGRDRRQALKASKVCGFCAPDSASPELISPPKFISLMRGLARVVVFGLCNFARLDSLGAISFRFRAMETCVSLFLCL